MPAADAAWGSYLGEARHPPSWVLPFAGIFFGLFGLLGAAAVVRGAISLDGGAIAMGLVFLVLGGGIGVTLWSLAYNRLHVWAGGMELQGPFGKTRMAFDEVTSSRVIMGGRGVKRPISTEFMASGHRRISVSTSWRVPDDVAKKLDEVSRAKRG